MAAPSDARIAETLLDLARRRGRGKSFCPSEAARNLAPDWRGLMPRIRAVAGRLQEEGRLQARQKGRAVDPAVARGPIRLSLPPG